ncbi:MULTISPECIES: hypothetical protein [unclassified Paenibacillus]|uniref:hypothetical protein n=1 Tax=unclassified Paenibacillus TaxID=185978 RepID=UPI002789EF62|nr:MULTISPECIES: hypothetical protein [unclassified Paenibacillus]MDQ0897269.1 ABC-type uncharacterized transport system permease subunit [Paenibacillus sp. V4I7]MDQ0916584.1 ABC-type uncharacterized transport system permease subunit [Paenibacillus sp. V4I5]
MIEVRQLSKYYQVHEREPRISGWQVIWSVGIAMVCFGLTRALWKIALRQYTSASS